MAKILILGTAVLDHVFRVAAFPAAPDKYRAESYSQIVGGCAATAAVTISRLGGQPQLCTRLGCDPSGEMILRDLAEQNVDCSLSVTRPSERTPVSSVLVDGRGQRQIMNFRGTLSPPAPAVLTEDVVRSCDAVLADTRWPEASALLFRLARQVGIAAVLDAEAPFDGLDETLALATHVAFSAPGLAGFTGQKDHEKALRAVARELDAWLCVTDGESGAWFRHGEAAGHVPAIKVEAVDTLGAGDVWHGAFALAIGEGRTEADAVALANAAAALKCRNGTGWQAIASRNETLALAAIGTN